MEFVEFPAEPASPRLRKFVAELDASHPGSVDERCLVAALESLIPGDYSDVRVADSDYYSADGEAVSSDRSGEPNAVLSLCENGLHAPAFDVDVPIDAAAEKIRSAFVGVPTTDGRPARFELVRSSSGNTHVYVANMALPWGFYEGRLRRLVDLGVVEHGYLLASIEREASRLRLPHVCKSSVDGFTLAELAAEYRRRHPDAHTVVDGHSVGCGCASCVSWALNQCPSEPVGSVHPLGGVFDAEAACGFRGIIDRWSSYDPFADAA